jgi:activator of 2-hydroxyglutaryl-CoA dehydratase
VFLDADRVNFQKEGFQAAEMLAGLAQVLPKNVWQYVAQVPALASLAGCSCCKAAPSGTSPR